MSGFVLKLIAALTMLIDHAGVTLFPEYDWMRGVGRIAMPLFAFCIAEGFRYTRSRKRYFWQIFLLGAACQAVYWFAMHDRLLGILLTFSVSLLLMMLADRLREAEDGPLASTSVRAVIFAAAVAVVLVLTRFLSFDYGFWGIMLPVWPSLFRRREYRLTAFLGGLTALCIESALGGNFLQSVSLFAMVPVCLYNGTPGKYRMKYFFYIFYPAHLGILQLIAWITEGR